MNDALSEVRNTIFGGTGEAIEHPRIDRTRSDRLMRTPDAAPSSAADLVSYWATIALGSSAIESNVQMTKSGDRLTTKSGTSLSVRTSVWTKNGLCSKPLRLDS